MSPVFALRRPRPGEEADLRVRLTLPSMNTIPSIPETVGTAPAAAKRLDVLSAMRLRWSPAMDRQFTPWEFHS